MTKQEIVKAVKRLPGRHSVKDLREDLARIETADDALDVIDRAARAKVVFTAIGRSVEECNQFAEIYLEAYWKFGDLVSGIKPWRPAKKAGVDTGFPGTEQQRKTGRRLREAVQATDIPEYVRLETEALEPATISGCLEWIDPGRHGNLKGEYEWYTPEEIIEAARDVMGGIDLDPASCEEAQATVQATQYFTEEQNGLLQTWSGRVFLNPPFAHPTVKFFAEKLLQSYQSGSVTQAVWLSNACTDTGWWQQLATNGPACFPFGRIRFKGPNDQGQSPTLGQTIVYLGDRGALFRDRFTSFGVVLTHAV